MGTIALYANKINQSICNLDDVISSIQASSQTQEEKIASLETFQQNSEQFIEETARIIGGLSSVRCNLFGDGRV